MALEHDPLAGVELHGGSVARRPGKADFSNLTFTINDSVFRYGSFLNALIAFVSIAAAVFFFVVKPVNAIQRRRGALEEEPESEADLLADIRDILKARGGEPGRG